MTETPTPETTENADALGRPANAGYAALDWKDCTTYSRGERGSKEPTTFDAVAGNVRLVVSCGHTFFRPGWAGSWGPFEREMRALSATTLEEAKREVYDNAAHCARQAVAALGAA